MHKRFRALAVASALCMLQAAAHAGSLRFEDALRQTLSNSPEVERERLAAEISELDIVRARSTFLPRVDLSIDSSRVTKQGAVPGLESLQLGGQNTAYISQSNLRVSMNVYNGGQDSARMDKAAEKYEEAVLQWRLRRAQVAMRLLDAYHVAQQALLDVRAGE